MNAPAALPDGLAERLHTVHVGVRAELEISRHVFSGKPVYVVCDPITFQSHRLSLADYQVFAAINSAESLGRTFDRLCKLGRLTSEQEESFFQFVINLNQLGLLTLPVSDGASLYSRFAKRRASERRAAILGALFLRVPLVQPDAFLDRTVRWFRPLFTPGAFVMWLMCVVACGFLVMAQWREFADPLGSLLAVQNLPVLWTLLVTLKIVHEFGHAYACKVLGGKVPEMGAFFIVFTPCAYVDASASWSFTRRSHRVLVALGGMYFESIIAMFALVVWAFTGPGIIHSAAQHAVVLSTIVTIGFNINPLMKYDGYYIVSDLLGMPDLRTQAQLEWTNVCKRLLFGIRPQTTSDSVGKRIGLACFGLAMSIYKVVIVFGISIMIAFKFPAVGIAIATFYVVQTLWQFLMRMCQFFQSDEIKPVRRRAFAVSGILIGSAVSLLLFFPVPGSPQALGVLAREHQHKIHAPTSGILVENSVQDGQEIDLGDSVCLIENPELAETLIQKSAELQQLQIDFQENLTSSIVQAISTTERIESLASRMQQIEREVEQLDVRSSVAGRVTNMKAIRDLGRFVVKGEPLVNVGSGRWVIKSLATADDVSIAKPKVGDPVVVKMVGAGPIHHGTIRQVSMAGSTTIDEEALTHLAGGTIPVDGTNMESAHPFFQVMVILDDCEGAAFRDGMTAWVQFPSTKPVWGVYIWRRLLGVLNKLRTAS